jgi:hypothetical protein
VGKSNQGKVFSSSNQGIVDFIFGKQVAVEGWDQTLDGMLVLFFKIVSTVKIFSTSLLGLFCHRFVESQV